MRAVSASGAALALLAGLSLLCAGCATLQRAPDEPEVPFVSEEAPMQQEPEIVAHEEEPSEEQATDGEVPLSVAESEPTIENPPRH